MSDPVFEDRVTKWLDDRPSLGQRGWRYCLSVYHSFEWPKFTGIGVTHWSARTALAASPPAVSHMTGGTITATTAAYAFAAMFVGHSFVSFLGATAEKKKKGSPIMTNTMVRIGDMLSASKLRRSSVPEKKDAIRAALGMIEMFGLEITGLTKGQISVSIARYEGSSSHQMRLEYRNTGNERPVPRAFDGTNTLGHRACLAGAKPQIVHDLRGFGKVGMRSPTQSAVNYRSFLIIPLTQERGGNQKIIGFLSIDATRPYSFLGRRGNDMVVHCQPIINHIQAIM